jgi:hypothetical protein
MLASELILALPCCKQKAQLIPWSPNNNQPCETLSTSKALLVSSLRAASEPDATSALEAAVSLLVE